MRPKVYALRGVPGWWIVQFGSTGKNLLAYDDWRRAIRVAIAIGDVR